MKDATPLHQTLIQATRRLLRPLVRLLLRYGVPYGQFAELAKSVYVEVAMSDFGLEKRKPSVSRASVLTGLSRKMVTQVMKEQDDHTHVEPGEYNRAARVISAWLREAPFCDGNGEPVPLPLEGEDKSFSELVRRYGGDVPVRATLDELLRVAAVRREEDDTLHLCERAYIPKRDEPAKLRILGRDVAGLISTIDHNLNDVQPLRFQRKVFYDNLPEEALDELQAMTRRHGQALIDTMDKWMAAHDRDANPNVKGTGRKRVGVGVFYFEETES